MGCIWHFGSLAAAAVFGCQTRHASVEEGGVHEVTPVAMQHRAMITISLASRLSQ